MHVCECVHVQSHAVSSMLQLATSELYSCFKILFSVVVSTQIKYEMTTHVFN